MRLILAFIALFSFSISAVSDDKKLDMKPAYMKGSDNIVTGGQPSKKDIQRLADKGVQVIINLRMANEYDQKSLKLASMHARVKHMSLPIRGMSGITLENATLLHEMLERDKDKKILVHCASSNRAGALLALRAYFFQGMSKTDAMKYGKEHGMKGLRVIVKNLINEAEKSKKEGANP